MTAVSKPINQGIFASTFSNWSYLVFLPFIAILTGYYVYLNPDYFELVLFLDLWLLGYHHLISTFSRIAFDKKSIKENWFFLLPLPIIVFTSVSILYYFFGSVGIASVYVYWQWYHYSRQSEGVSKAYGMKSSEKHLINHKLNRFVFYTVPLLCFLWMVSRDNNTFLGLDFIHINIHQTIRIFMLSTIVTLTLLWIFNAIRWLYSGSITLYYFVYMIGHFSIYYVSYILIDELSIGWLTINIWHNAQYIGIVWLFNKNKYKSGIDKEHLIISYLSQPQRFFMYMMAFVALTWIVYSSIDKIIDSLSIGLTGLPLILIVYSSLNMHHYIIDSKIWKLRKKSISNNLS
jgi:hypothetical protein